MERTIEHPHEHAEELAALGSWEPVRYRCKSLPVHVALLHTGQVLLFGGTCNNLNYIDHPKPAQLWDPVTGEVRIIEQELGGDVFCAGHTTLPDGRLLVAGGTTGYDIKRNIFGQEIPLPPFRGLNQTYLFDPLQERWTRGDNLAAARWYPTLITLGDGRVIAMAGLTDRFPWAALRKIEIYNPGQGWQVLKGAERWLPLYPRLHLLPDGRVFYSGSYNTHYTFPFSLRQFPTSILDPNTGEWDSLGLPNKSEREEGTTVLLPLDPPDYHPRVLLAGGGTPQGVEATSDCEIIDLSDPQPRWQIIEPMHHARYYVYPVLLPDGKFLALGGRAGAKGHDPVPAQPGHPDHLIGGQGAEMDGSELGDVAHDPSSVMEPELFDPETGHWSLLAPMTVDRLYHSCAVLLPDGRVAAFGSNPQRGLEELRIEIYHPPYLFRGDRPRLNHAPQSAAYGQEFEIESPQSAQITQVVLIRPTVTTHCVNTDQRLVRLEFKQVDDNTLQARLPENPNLLPPGYFMLFILNNGIPSVGKMIHIHPT